VSRPRALDGEAAAKVIEATRKGLTRAVAARAAGISPTTLYKELRENPQFAQAIKEAQASGEEALVDIIKGHAFETWQAAAWLLERRYPERYGPPKQRLQHEVTPMTPEQAAAKYRELTGQDWKAAS
jgi:transposase